MERRFWKQLKRRRSGANAVISSPQVAAWNVRSIWSPVLNIWSSMFFTTY